MKHFINDNKKNIISFIAIALILFALVYSTFYVADNTNHRCIGEDCPICATILQSERCINELGGVVAIAVAICVAVGYLYGGINSLGLCLISMTPVSNKVRLNN